jgi:hypothetical protein
MVRSRSGLKPPDGPVQNADDISARLAEPSSLDELIGTTGESK